MPDCDTKEAENAREAWWNEKNAETAQEAWWYVKWGFFCAVAIVIVITFIALISGSQASLVAVLCLSPLMFLILVGMPLALFGQCWDYWRKMYFSRKATRDLYRVSSSEEAPMERSLMCAEAPAEPNSNRTVLALVVGAIGLIVIPWAILRRRS